MIFSNGYDLRALWELSKELQRMESWDIIQLLIIMRYFVYTLLTLLMRERVKFKEDFENFVILNV
jgi:hypothetical protein